MKATRSPTAPTSGWIAISRLRADGSRASRRSSARFGSRARSGSRPRPTRASAPARDSRGPARPTTAGSPRAPSPCEKPSAEGPTHNDPPIVNVRHLPRLGKGSHDEPAVHELVKSLGRDRSASEIWEGDATLTLYEAPNEEHAALAPVRVGKGFRFTLGYSVDDLETLVEL